MDVSSPGLLREELGLYGEMLVLITLCGVFIETIAPTDEKHDDIMFSVKTYPLYGNVYKVTYKTSVLISHTNVTLRFSVYGYLIRDQGCLIETV